MGGLAILSIALYANTLGHGFILDDFPVLLKHRYVNMGFGGIPDILGTPYWHGYSAASNGLYRPLPLVVFAIQHGLFGADPLPGHILNVLLFAGCVLLLFRFILVLFGRERVGLAAIAALLFAVHPVHTEVVANIKSCDELLCFSFSIASLMGLLNYLDGGKPVALTAAFAAAALALLSKETAIFLVVIGPLTAWAYRRPARVRAIAGSAVFVLATALFLLIRHQVLAAYDPVPFRPSLAENALAAAPGIGARLPLSLGLLGHYLQLLFVPAPLICDYSYTTIPPGSWSTPAAWIALAAYLGLAAIAIYRLFKEKRDPIAYGILFYLCGIALFSNLAFLIGATFAERFLFLPSAGFCIAIGAFLLRGTDNAAGLSPAIFIQKKRWLMLAVFAVFAGMTLVRNAEWKDEETLFKKDMRKAPRNFRIPYYFATHYVLQIPGSRGDTALRQERMEQAADLLEQSVLNYNGYLPALAQLGNIYLEIGPRDSGVAYCQYVLERNPRDTFTRNNLAGFYFRQGAYQYAIILSRINLQIDSQYFLGRRNLGACYLKLGQADSALPELRKAWQLRPGEPRTGYFLNVAYSMNGQPDSAARYAAYAR